MGLLLLRLELRMLKVKVEYVQKPFQSYTM